MSDEPTDRGAPALRETSPDTPQIRAAVTPDALPAAPLRGEVEPLGAGALTEASVEIYMDGQEKALRGQLRDSGIAISRRGNDLTLDIPDDSVFATNSVSLTARGSDVIRTVARILSRYDSTQLHVNGYTDTTGTAARNLDVSQKRADAVARALSAGGVERSRIDAKGFGESDLNIPTGLDIDEPRNRRIEIDIAPRMKE